MEKKCYKIQIPDQFIHEADFNLTSKKLDFDKSRWPILSTKFGNFEPEITWPSCNGMFNMKIPTECIPEGLLSNL